MDTDKSFRESNACSFNRSCREPDYLSGKVIDGLNGKLFHIDKFSYDSIQSKN